MKKILAAGFVLFLCAVYPTDVVASAVDFAQTLKDMGANFCWFCDIFGTLFDAMNTIATTIAKDMSQTFLAILGVALLFSIGFKTAKMLTSLQEVDVMQYLTDLFRHLGRAIIAAAFLWASLSVFTYIVSPILTMSLSLSTTIIDKADISGTIIRASQERKKAMDEAGIEVQSICRSSDDNAVPLLVNEATQEAQQAFAPSVKAALICLLRTVSASLITGMAVGGTIYAFGWIDRVLVVFPNFLAVLIGIIIWFGHLLIFVAVPFKYIDSMIRMAFVCALMPLWIVLWVFPKTVGYTKKAWDMFLSTCAIFLCMSVVLVLVIHLINAAIPPTVLEKTITYLTNGEILKAMEVFQVSLRSLLVTVIMCFTGYKMLGTATTLASSFISTIPNLGVGDQMAKTSLKVGKMGALTGGALGMAGARGAKAGLNKISPGLGDKVSSAVTSPKALRAAAAVATFGNSELLIAGAKGIRAAAKGGLSLASKAVNAYKNRYANAPSPTLGAQGTDMGVDTGAMGLAQEKTFSTTENGVSVERNQKTYRDADGNQLTQTFDKKGNLRGETLQRKDGSSHTKLYDQKGKLTEEFMKKADNSGVKNFYKRDGSLEVVRNDTKTFDGEQGKTTTRFDKAGNIVSSTVENEQGGSTTRFDKAGNIVSSTVENEQGKTTTRFDKEGKAVSQTFTNEQGGSTTRFDKAGNAVSETVVNEQGRTTTRFDEGGNVRSVTHRDTNDNVETKKYNEAEQLVSEKYRDKDGNGHDMKHNYDAAGNYYATDIQYTDGAERGVLRDEKGNVTGLIQINSDGSAYETEYKNGEAVKTTHYDKDGNVETEVIHDVKERHIETTEREVVHEREGSPAPAEPAPTPAPAAPAPASEPKVSETPSGRGSGTSRSSDGKGQSDDGAKALEEARRAAEKADAAKSAADDARMIGQMALGEATRKSKNEKDKNRQNGQDS